MRAGVALIVLALLGGCGADGRPIPPGGEQAAEVRAGTAGAQTQAAPVPTTTR